MRIVRFHREKTQEGLARDFSLSHKLVFIIDPELASENFLHALGEDFLDAFVEVYHDALLLLFCQILELHFFA